MLKRPWSEAKRFMEGSSFTFLSFLKKPGTLHHSMVSSTHLTLEIRPALPECIPVSAHL